MKEFNKYTPSILITGSSGFIGSSLVKHFKMRGYSTVGVDVTRSITTNSICDVSDRSSLMSILCKFSPDIIVHAAAVKDLLIAEGNKKTALLTNVLSTEVLAEYISGTNKRIIYISSDVVFDGKTGRYTESSTPNPINWYGKTKLFSEDIVNSIRDNSTICRTALVIGKLDHGYTELFKRAVNKRYLSNQTMLPQYIYSRLARGKSVILSNSIISNPTPVELLCEQLERVLDKGITGILNTAGPEYVSRYKLALLISEAFGFNNDLVIEGNLNPSNLRPNDLSLETTMTFSKLGISSKEWSLGEYLSRGDLYV